MESFIKSIETQLNEAPLNDMQTKDVEMHLINLVKDHLSAKAKRRILKDFQRKHGVACPAMPIRTPLASPHRQLISQQIFPAMVARPVTKKEMMSKEAAVKAMRDEWTRLWDKGVWDRKDVK